MNVGVQAILFPILTLQQIRDNFVEELQRALKGKKTSLAFLANPLPSATLVRDGEAFQVMVIGGSHFETAMIEKRKGKITITDGQKVDLGSFATKDELFSFIAEYIDARARVVGINFAFPLSPVTRKSRLDGVYVGSAEKQHGLVGLRGKLVGKELEKYLERHKKRVVVSIGHDLLCLGLSALSVEKWESVVCGIVGTGFNLGFFSDARTLINIEAGRFDKFDQTQTGKVVDAASKSPGKKKFEKEVAGAFLYQHFNLLRSNHTPLSSTEELDRVARGKDEQAHVAQQLLERSASLIACQIVGIYLWLSSRARQEVGVAISTGLPRSLSLPRNDRFRMTFVMEGSLFWKGWRYKEMINRYLEKLGVSKEAIRFVEIKKSPLLGAAALIA